MGITIRMRDVDSAGREHRLKLGQGLAGPEMLSLESDNYHGTLGEKHHIRASGLAARIQAWRCGQRPPRSRTGPPSLHADAVGPIRPMRVTAALLHRG